MIKIPTSKSKMDYPKFWLDYVESFSSKHPDALEENTFVVWDTETTGFDFEKDCVLSIGALKLQENEISVKNTLEVFIEQKYYNSETAEIHGILKKERKKSTSELKALEVFLNFIGNRVLVGHHIGFDVGMINKALDRYGMPGLKNTTLDTGLLYKRTLLTTPMLQKKENYSLDDLAEKFSISRKDRHTALGDAYITAVAFLEIMERLKPKNLKELLKLQNPYRFRLW